MNPDQSGTPSRWDECWECPRCGIGIGIGDGKRNGGNAIVTFTVRCGCGAEMEQVTNIGINPEEC